jgi:hypothetical protein
MIMRTALTSGAWVEAVAALAAALLMTVAGFAALQDVAATPAAAVIAPIHVLDVVGTSAEPAHVAMPHVDVSRG